ALRDVERHVLERKPELRQHEADLVAVARDGVVVEAQHVGHSSDSVPSRAQSSAWPLSQGPSPEAALRWPSFPALTKSAPQASASARACSKSTNGSFS